MARDCIAATLAVARNALSQQEVKSLVKELEGIANRQKNAGSLANLEEDMARIAKDMADDSSMASKIEKRNRLINIMVERKADEDIAKFKERGLKFADGIESILVGHKYNVEGARLSAEARQKEYTGRLLGVLISKLKQLDVLEAFTDHRSGIEKNVAIELFEMDKEGGRIGITGDKMALKVAQAINYAQESARRLTNMAGANIRKMPGYIVRQVHDPNSMIKAGLDEWRTFTMPLLDIRKTFGGTDAEKGMQIAYRHLTTGSDMFLVDQLEPGEVGFTGPGNLAKRLSQSRVLHFKDGESWWTYNQRFGRKYLNESVIGGLEMAGHNIGLMQTLGTNPQAMLDKLIGKYQNLAQIAGDAKDVQRLKGAYIKNLYKQINGEAHRVDNWNLAYVGSSIRAIQSTAKLGGAMLSSLADIVTAASELRFQGKGLLQSYADLIKERSSLISENEKNTFHDMLGVGFDGMRGGIIARFHANDQLPGRLSRLQQSFLKLNGLEWWTNSWQKAVGGIMAYDLARHADVGTLDKADPQFRNLLSLYNIKDKEWNLYRGLVQAFPDGRRYLTPDLIGNLTDEQVKGYLGKPDANRYEIARAKDELSGKLRAMLIDRVDHAVIKPDARTNILMNWGLERGTAAGEAVRSLMQFKSFTLAMAQKIWQRELYGHGANSLSEAILKGKGDLRGIAHILALSTVMGYISMTAKDFFKGRKPRDPEDPNTWLASFLQGGGAGIYGDFLFGAATRYGNSFWATALGPTGGSIEDAYKLYSSAIQGQDTASQGLKLALSHTPFINLFWLRPALDYLFLYDIQESLNPGSLGRLEGYAKKNNNQEYFLKPTEDRLRPFTGTP